ncbi:hypothetical protein IW148_002404 [Coemansia sp. RSA 1199]|nr:hypothetical protein IW148_002404 [Coemansia sp. RSA 1199]
MSLEQIRKEIADSRPTESPVGGRYIALLRRTPTGMLFSDPVYVPTAQSLPDLPDGVEYIVVHPQTTTATAPLLEAYMPTDALSEPTPSECPRLRLPVFEDSGMYSSFLPSRDSSLTSLSAEDFVTLNSGLVGKCSVLDVDVDHAVELADRILSGSADHEPECAEISPDTLHDLGLLPSDVGLDSSTDNSAQSILREHSTMLAQLQQLQDARAQSSNYGKISDHEQQIAKRLQTSLANVVAAHAPAHVRPPLDEIQKAVKLLLGGEQATYAGTLPPQRRFAFMSNAVAGSNVPQNATIAPMQQVPDKK